MNPQPSNTVLLMSDEHNPFYASVYGHPFVQTPHMEALARAGTVFKNAYCPSPLCLPSRSAFVSGQRVHALQTYSNCKAGLDTSFTSYGERLHQQGIHAAHIGKTDFYDNGINMGFSEMILPRDRVSPGDTRHRRNPMTVRENAEERFDRYGPKEEATHQDLERVAAAVEWLMTKAPTLKTPWVLAINVESPHFPHYTTQELWNLYESHGDLPAHGEDLASAQHPYSALLRKHFKTMNITEEQVRGLRRGYYGCVTFLDRLLGTVMQTIQQANLSESTNIIYASDHGEMLGKFGMWWKCSLYEDSVRIPCIAAGPDFREGAIVQTPVDLHDVQAFLFASTHAERPPDWVGTPLHQLPHDDRERVIFSEYHGHGAPGSSYMVRKGAWKYIHYIDAPHQLFNLEQDPDELEDFSDAHPDVARKMKEELYAICDPEREHRRAEKFIEAQLADLASTPDPS